MEYEAVIGLEIHVQLNCPTKMFCDCPNHPSDRPNSNVCPICLWMPGALPQLSEDALERAVLTGMALNAEIQPLSAFDQKVYYYPDLPKGFQLSQFHRPFARNGYLDIHGQDGQPRRIGIHEIHMEEDVAKLVHETEGQTRISLVDFNRAGVPLAEVVTEPDLRSGRDAVEFLRALRTQIRYVGTAECSMESGTMRVDANISLRPTGSDELNTKVEVKNMNSLRAVSDAINHEIARQTERLNSGESIVLHTRLWDSARNVTTPMRAKFSGPCVPDPSVPQIVLSDEWLTEIRARLPEMPGKKRGRFLEEYGLMREEAAMMSAERSVAEYFEDLVTEGAPPRTAAQWIAAQLLPALKERNQTPSNTPVTASRLAALLAMLGTDEINANAAREVLGLLFETDKTPAELVAERSLRQIGDADWLEAVLDEIIAAHPKAAADFRSGRKQAAGFLIGQAIQASQGKANPKLLAELLKAKLA